MNLALLFLFALIVSAALVPLCRAVAFRLGYIANPAGPQAPPRPKALFGGVAVALTLAAGTAAVGAAQSLPVLLMCGAALCFVGLASDLFRLPPYTKLIAVIVIASVFLFFDLRLRWSESETLDSIITVFWIVGITTAFDLLDNMDGLCAGIALIAGTAFLLTVLPVPPAGPLFQQTQYLTILLGAVAGLLIYNVHPASIALGEAGSLLIGLNMAAMTLQIAPGRGSGLLSIIAVPALLLLIPIGDAVLATLSRGRSTPQSFGRSSTRLLAMGLSERTVVGLLWALAAASGAVAVIADRGQGLSGLVVATFTIAMALFAVNLARVRVHENADPSRVTGAILPLGMEHGYRRRIVEVLLDLALVAVAYYGAHRLRFDAVQWAENFPYFLQSLPIVVGVQTIALFVVGAYRGMWRYFSLSDGLTFAKAVFMGAVTSQVVLLYLYRFEGYTAGIFIVYSMLLLLLLGGSRASFRLVGEFLHRQRHVGLRLVLYGAGDAGATAVRYLLNDPGTPYRIVGFIDDDFRKRSIRVHGYSVIGGYDHLAGMIMAGEVDAVALTEERPETPALASLCAAHGVTLQRFSVDWQDITAEQPPLAVARGGAFSPVQPRVVPFTGGRRPPVDRRALELRAAASAAHESPRVGPPPVAAAPDSAPPIRVAHIITRLILGGAQENTVYTAIGQHRDSRFDVTLVCGVDEVGEGNMFGEVNRAGVKTVVMPSLVREIRPLADLKAFFDLYRFLKRGAFSVVHTHSSKAGVVGRAAARAAGVPVIVHTIHGVAFHEFQSAWKNRLYVLLERLCAPLAHRIISVSALIGQAAQARGIGRVDQHVTIFSGIELDRFLSIRDQLSTADAKARLGIPSEAPVVGKVARLFPLKGHEQFLAAAAEISRQMPETRFLLVGDGPLRDELRQTAERLGLADHLVMVGRVPPEDVPGYLQAMDVVVHTSLREGIARVLPQAGAVGKPVVTFYLDGAPEVVQDGTSGYLIPALDMNHVAERTVELLRDPGRRKAFGEAGRAFAAEYFSVERMVERINAVYLDLLGRG